MNRILVNFHPTSMMQNIMFFIDEECIEYIDTTLNEIVPIINILREKYTVNEIDLLGSRDFVSKYEKELIDVTQYSDIEIKVIEE